MNYSRPTTSILFALIWSVFLIWLGAEATAAVEIYRIRIENKPRGLVQISVDAGRSYKTVGMVTSPANSRAIGFPASSYTPEGTVAATSIQGIRVKVGSFVEAKGKAQMPLIFSISPAEFSGFPEFIFGEKPKSSTIHTDIFAGQTIFRNQAPFVGNAVMLESDLGLSALPDDYTPRARAVFVIIVRSPENPLSSVVFENKAGGSVTAAYLDGTTRVLARVVREVTGIGRYDGTTYTGVGAINTNHGGVITFSTAPVCPPGTPDRGSKETRGGFMVQPYHHYNEQRESRTQVMVIRDTANGPGPGLEGTSPLFLGHFNLFRYEKAPELSYRVQFSIDDGDWEDPPAIVGRIDDALTSSGLNHVFSSAGSTRRCTKGLTAFRVLCPQTNLDHLVSDIDAHVRHRVPKHSSTAAAVLKGVAAVRPPDGAPHGALVDVSIDGRHAGTSNVHPYEIDIDTAKLHDGLHSLRFVLSTGERTQTSTVEQVICVSNGVPDDGKPDAVADRP